MKKDFNESRREIAYLLCSQTGRTWGGLSIEQRDALMDAADSAVRARDIAFDQPRPTAMENIVVDAVRLALEQAGHEVQSIDDPGRGQRKTIVLADGRVLSAPSFTECLEQLS